MAYDDFLNLGDLDLSPLRLIVFSGVSGSGKSTALRFLAESHASFHGRRVLRVAGDQLLVNIPPVENHLILFDEVAHVRQLAGLSRLIRSRNTVAVASHVPAMVFWPFHMVAQTRQFRTDCDRAKILRYLERSQVRYSPEVVDEYCRLYGANFLDLQHMLERFPGKDFDRTFVQFRKFCRVAHVPF